MLRQVTSRNQRSKGFTVKNALQICILAIVCLWIFYQFKHSHDKRTAYEEGGEVTAKFRRKNLPHTVKSHATTKTKIEGRRKDGSEDVAQEFRHKQVRKGDEKNGRIEELRVVESQSYEDASREARENSFKGDDASSEVVPTTPEVEHEVASRKARKGSFKDDDVSRSVDHATVSEDAGIRSLDEKLMEGAETEDVVNETLEDFKGSNSSALELMDMREANIADAVLKGNQTGIGIPILESRFQSNMTRNESDTHVVQQPGLTNANVDDQKELKVSSKNVMFRGSDLHMNLTAANLTSVSHNNTTNFVPLESGMSVLPSVQGQNASTGYMQTEKSEKSKITDRLEESEKSSKTYATEGDKVQAVPVESENTSAEVAVEEKGDALTDLSNSQSIQNSGKQEATD